MRADADEAVRRFAAGSFVTPASALLQGIARVLRGDLEGAIESLEDAVSAGEVTGAPDYLAVGLCERSLVAMAHSERDGPRSFPDGHAPFCAGPGSRKAM